VSALRERILNAAADLYEREGYHGATTRRIAAAAGVNEVTLFRLFSSKAGLGRAVLERAAAVPLPVLSSSPGDPPAALTSWGCALLEAMRERRLAARGLSDLAGLASEGDGSLRAGGTAALEAYLATLGGGGMLSRDAPIEAAAAMYVGALESRAAATAESAGDDRAVCDQFTAVLFRAIGVRAAPLGGPLARAPAPPFVPDATGA
jgi:AcrR family transcriptional regulator